ncbi:MAG: hypothetical protein AB2693_11625 [Candidatus Thiodiazotropha sp.]
MSGGRTGGGGRRVRRLAIQIFKKKGEKEKNLSFDYNGSTGFCLIYH